MQETECNGSSQGIEVIHPQQRLKCKYSIQKAWKRVRSLARIKVSAFGAGDRGFKSHRTRFPRVAFILPPPVVLGVLVGCLRFPSGSRKASQEVLKLLSSTYVSTNLAVWSKTKLAYWKFKFGLVQPKTTVRVICHFSILGWEHHPTSGNSK
jgi:hypothetical protein